MYTEDEKDYNENEVVSSNNNDDYSYGEHYEEPELDNHEQQNSSNKSKSFIIVIILVIVLIVLIFLLIKSCDNNSQNKPNDDVKQPVLVELSKDTLELKVGESYKIEYSVSNYSLPLEIVWISNNESVANIKEDGTVTAVKVGNTSVIASYFIDNIPYQKECIVNVIENDGIDVNDNEKPILKYSLDNCKVNEWGNSNVKININATDNSGVVDVKYTLDCTNNCNYISVTNNVIEISKEGTTIVTIMASDKNSNSIQETLTVKIDKTKPACSLNINENGLLVADYKDTGGSDISYYGFSPDYSGESLKQKNVTEGNYHFYVKDKAGNTNSCNINVLKKVQYRYQDCTSCKTCGKAGCGEWEWSKVGTSYLNATCTKSPNDDVNRNCRATNATGTGICSWVCDKYEKTKCLWNKRSCDACGCSSWGAFTSWSETPATASSSRQVETKTIYVKG